MAPSSVLCNSQFLIVPTLSDGLYGTQTKTKAAYRLFDNPRVNMWHYLPRTTKHGRAGRHQPSRPLPCFRRTSGEYRPLCSSLYPLKDWSLWE